ncbi:hypothetical protein C1H84_14135 [Glutamicibacter soli]|uniref:Uncharacterized protein n=1 Tax=Glutamicibacter soli TaxID=453836 RepID=A0A365YA41_9MICC|nr:hypothetical protein C1H84_14135 [Glutamicibacter soli]
MMPSLPFLSTQCGMQMPSLPFLSTQCGMQLTFWAILHAIIHLFAFQLTPIADGFLVPMQPIKVRQSCNISRKPSPGLCGICRIISPNNRDRSRVKHDEKLFGCSSALPAVGAKPEVPTNPTLKCMVVHILGILIGNSMFANY